MKFTKLFTAFSLACLLAACSSNTPASDSNTNHAQNQTSVNDEKTSDDTNTNNNSSNSSNSSNTNSNQNSGNAYAAGSEFENAFANAGYDIIHTEQEHDEYSFDAKNNAGRVDFDLSLYSNADRARNEYSDDLWDETDDDYNSLFELEQNGKLLSRLQEAGTSRYKLIGCNPDGSFTFEMDDLSNEQYNNVLQILDTLGYPVQF